MSLWKRRRRTPTIKSSTPILRSFRNRKQGIYQDSEPSCSRLGQSRRLHLREQRRRPSPHTRRSHGNTQLQGLRSIGVGGEIEGCEHQAISHNFESLAIAQ